MTRCNKKQCQRKHYCERWRLWEQTDPEDPVNLIFIIDHPKKPSANWFIDGCPMFVGNDEYKLKQKLDLLSEGEKK